MRFPNMTGKIKFMFQTTNQNGLVFLRENVKTRKPHDLHRKIPMVSGEHFPNKTNPLITRLEKKTNILGDGHQFIGISIPSIFGFP